MVDNSREEHRMMIFSNDSETVQSHLIKGTSKRGLLRQKIHDESYTVTLYALLKNYGLIPVMRIKPRIRFTRSNYDNLSSSAPLCYQADDLVQFAELKRGDDVIESGNYDLLEDFFGDATTIENLSADPAQHLTAQRDLFLKQPPFKSKTKVFGSNMSQSGIPIGHFLDGLNSPQKTEAIFSQYPSGNEFARDLLEAIEPFGEVEFQFGLYSRYERRDCVLTDSETDGYRTTFDPFTTLGYIRSEEQIQQLQILTHERGSRWEHKILIDQLPPPVFKSISGQIKSLRRKYLISRLISKSQTGLTYLAKAKESELGVVRDLLVGYQLILEVSTSQSRMSSINCRKELRAMFTSSSLYQLHPFDTEISECHLNLAKGIKNGVVYSLDSVYLTQSLASQRTTEDDITVVRNPIGQESLVRSAQELRERIPTNGFEECWNESISRAGYTVVNQRTGRCYSVSYETKKQGKILNGKESIQQEKHLLSIRYLGLDHPDRMWISNQQYNNSSVPVSILDTTSKKEYQIIEEMKDMVIVLRAKRLI